MKWLGQSKYNTQLCLCLVMKIKSDATKNNISWELEMLGPSIKKIGCRQAGDGKNRHQLPRNLGTKMDRNDRI